MCITIHYFLVLPNLIWVSSFVPPSSLINDAAKVNKAVFMPAVYILLYLKRHDDAHAHNISNIDVLYDFHLIYISYENINFWIITVLKKMDLKLSIDIKLRIDLIYIRTTKKKLGTGTVISVTFNTDFSKLTFIFWWNYNAMSLHKYRLNFFSRLL